MKQKIKQLLMAIVGLLLSTSAFAHDFSVGGIYYNYLDKTAKTVAVTYRGSSIFDNSNTYNGSVTIPSSVTYSGTTYSVTSIGVSAFRFCSGLTSITISNSVTEIDELAFCGCTGLTSITIPNSVTSIGNYAFSGCTGLTEVNISDLSAWCKIDFVNYSANPLNYAKKFKLNGAEIKDLVIPNDVTEIKNYAFSRCDGLTSVTIPNSVTSIGNYAFNDCTRLTELIIEDGKETLSLGYNYNTSSSSIGEGLFYDCPLEKLYLGRNLNYPSTKYCGYSPFYSSKIYSLTIVSEISSIPSGAFSVKPKKTIWLTNTPPSGYSNAAGTINYVANDQYSSLSNVKVYPYLSSMFEVDGVKYVPVSPSERTCDAIDCTYNPTDTIINIGNTVTFKGVAMTVKEINPYICYGNSHIKECKIDYNGNIPNYAFYGCSAIEKATINAETIGESAFQNSATINPATFSINTNSIGDYAFYGCSAIENATIYAETIGESAFQNSATKTPATFSIDTKSISDYAFKGCSAIENATINAETIGKSAFENSATINPATFYVDAKSIAESTFDGCSEIETITLGTELETIGNSAFNSCSKLNEVIIPNSVTSLGESAFYGCSSITSATIGNAVENINASTFYNCKSLENITIGNTVKSIGNNTFCGCSSLPSIEIPKNVTSIGDYAFDDCSKLNDVIIEDRDTVLTLGSNDSSPIFSNCPLDSVYIGGDISYKTTSKYGYSPFYNNKTLRAVTITDKETEISDNEFYGCANLKSVSIGDGVETIGKYAFSGCSSLESFAFGTSMKTIGEEAFSDCTALVKLHSKATTPPACGTQALDDINKWNCELIVPDDAISAYQTADQWKEFFFISPNKINEITTNVNDAIEIARYDIHGRLLSEPTKGINIIKYSDGSTRKEIVK